MSASALAIGLGQAGPTLQAQPLSAGALQLLQRLAGLRSETQDSDAESLDPQVLQRLFDAGLFALTIPTAFGGLGGDHRLFAQAMVEVGRLGAQYAITAVPHLCNGVKSIALFASDAMRERVFRDVVVGRRLISFALTEDHTGSDVASLRTCLEDAGEGRFRLNGSKLWITNVPLAGHLVVVARCPTLSRNPKGAVFVLVPRDQPGLSVSRPWKKLTADACETVSLFFDAAPISREQLFGNIGGAIDHFNTIVESGRLGTAGGALGLAMAAWDSVVADPCPSPVAFADLQADARLLVMQQVLAQSAAFSDARYADHQITTALCKAYCAQRSLDLVRSIYERCADAGVAPPAKVAHALKSLPLFKILEGPSEVICLHAGISLLTRFGSPSHGGQSQRGSHEDSRGEALVPLLARFHAALSQARNVSGLVSQQLLVLAVADAAMHLHAALCACQGLAQDADLARRARALVAAEAAQALQRLEGQLRDPSAERSEALFVRMPKDASGCHLV